MILGEDSDDDMLDDEEDDDEDDDDDSGGSESAVLIAHSEAGVKKELQAVVKIVPSKDRPKKSLSNLQSSYPDGITVVQPEEDGTTLNAYEAPDPIHGIDDDEFGGGNSMNDSNDINDLTTIIKTEKLDDEEYSDALNTRPKRRCRNPHPVYTDEPQKDVMLVLKLSEGSISRQMMEKLSRRKSSMPMKLNLEDFGENCDDIDNGVSSFPVQVGIQTPDYLNDVIVKPLKKRMLSSSKYASSGDKKRAVGRPRKSGSSSGESRERPPHKKAKVKCDKCDKHFRNEKSLGKHVKKIHEREGQFQCPVCNMKFARIIELTRHAHVHSSDPYRCLYCEYESTNPWHYKSHMADVHEDFKAFHCKHEGCTFKSNKPCNVDVHAAIHSPLKRYKCNKCFKSFSQSNGLRSHLRSCFQERQFRCEICGGRFNHQQSLQSHMRKHTGELLQLSMTHLFAHCKTILKYNVVLLYIIMSIC